MSFVGIGIESGQEKRGLNLSSQVARSYLQRVIEFSDYGDINSNIFNKKIFSYEHLTSMGIAIYAQAAQTISTAMASHDFHLNWGGDHSIGWATISAFLNHYPGGRVIWIDAHADMNRPDTSTTGNLHGMPLSFLLGLNEFHEPHELANRLRPHQLIYVGLRSLDPFEEKTIKELQIPSFDMKFIKQFGIIETCRHIEILCAGAPVHISFDIDSVDPLIAPSTGVPVKNGLNRAQLSLLSDFLANKTRFKSLDIVEINPMIGIRQEVESTYNLAFAFLHKFIPLQKIRGKDAFRFSTDKRKFSASAQRGF